VATEILRPNAAGDEESITSATSGAGNHWADVDEAVADNSTTYVYQSTISYLRDLYNLPAHSVGSGVINSITIYFRIRSGYTTTTAYAKPSQKSGATTTDGTEQTVTGTTWTTKSQTYNTNPTTSAAYTWDEIDALQIGIQLKHSNAGFYNSRCTQVYVEVDYTAVTFIPWAVII